MQPSPICCNLQQSQNLIWPSHEAWQSWKGPLQIEKAVYTLFNTFIPLSGPPEMKIIFVTARNFLFHLNIQQMTIANHKTVCLF